MIVCPVCEHQQSTGEECESCGIRFSNAIAVPVEVPLLEGLEPTVLSGGDVPVDGPRADWVEPTVLSEGEVAVETEAMLEIEPTLLVTSAVPSSLEMLPEGDAAAPDWLDPTAVVESTPESPEPLQVVCRYCRTPAVSDEALCSRCGMRLPIWKTAAPERQENTLCTDCGTPVQGAICRACGARRASTSD